MKRIGCWVLALAALAPLIASGIAPHDASAQFRDFPYAPPMLPHVIDDRGDWHLPFVYPVRLVSRLELRYEVDRTIRVPLVWLAGGKLVRAAESASPWFALGTDGFGRDVFSRLLFGARVSLALSIVAMVIALAMGLAVGAIAGYWGGWVDLTLMGLADFVLVLPAIYVVLGLRSVLPLVLSPEQVFGLVAAILAAVGWPFVARGVRAVVSAERRKDYAASARAIGAGHLRVLCRHLLPACRGVVATQAALLLPAFILAEATLSYVGLGFPDTTASWGSMLHEAANVTTISSFPWMLAPAGAIFVVVLAVHVVVDVPPLTFGGAPYSLRFKRDAKHE